MEAVGRLVLEGTKPLARVLGVTPKAVRVAEQVGRITREPDGRWNVGAVLEGWRFYTHPSLQRRPIPSWLDPTSELTPRKVRELARRALAEGATIVE